MKNLRQNAVLCITCLLLAACNDGKCKEKLLIDSYDDHQITVSWHHACYTCDTWEVCYKEAGMFNRWVCIPYASAGSVYGDSYTISGLKSDETYIIEIKNAMGTGCRLKSMGTVQQKTR